MESKSNKYLVGLICIILGIYFIASEYFSFRVDDAIMFIWGGALLLLYHTKRKVWALVLGIIIYSLWLFKMFPHLGAGIVIAMVFIVPGIIFMILFFSKRRNSFLITGSILAWFGISIFLGNIPILNLSSGAIFFICMGLSFFNMYLFNKNEIGKWPLVIACILCVFGILVYLGGSPFTVFFRWIPSFIPLIFIIVGLIIIIKAIANKN